MTDWLSVMERGLKAVRYGIFQANDNLAYLLEGLCSAPEDPGFPCVVDDCPERFTSYSDLNNHSYWEHLQNDPFKVSDDPRVTFKRYPGADKVGDFVWHRVKVTSSSSAPADYPLAGAVVAPSPKQGSDSGPADSDIPPSSPAGPHPDIKDASRALAVLLSKEQRLRRDAEPDGVPSLDFHSGRCTAFSQAIRILNGTE